LENQLLDIAFGVVLGDGPCGIRYARQILDASLKVNCPQCGKTVKAVGLEQHIRDKHK
jgi:hypothetical protein